MQTDLSDGHIGIRPFRQSDVPLLFAATRESISELSAWMLWCRPNYTLEDCAAFISRCEFDWAKGEQFSFVIYDVKTGAFLGSIGVNRVNQQHNFANLGYWVRSSRTRQGVAPAAIRLAARFAIEQLGFNRLEILTATGNRSSQRVAEKAGAKREGTLRKRLMLHGKPHDVAVYSLLAEDLRG